MLVQIKNQAYETRSLSLPQGTTVTLGGKDTIYVNDPYLANWSYYQSMAKANNLYDIVINGKPVDKLVQVPALPPYSDDYKVPASFLGSAQAPEGSVVVNIKDNATVSSVGARVTSQDIASYDSAQASASNLASSSASVPTSQSSAASQASQVSQASQASAASQESKAASKVEVTEVVFTTDVPSTMKKGDSFSASASVEPDDATDKSVTYSSSDESILHVTPSQGQVSTVANGKADLIATATNGKKVSSTITVTGY